MSNTNEKSSNKLSSTLISIVIIIVLGYFLFFYGKGPNTNNVLTEPTTRSYPIMGTWAQITFYGDTNTVNQGMDKVQEAFNIVNEKCNIYNPESELSKLNATAAQEPFECSDLLWNLLIQSKYFYDLSDGALDVTIKPLMCLWGFFKEDAVYPNKEEIAETVSKIGMDKVIFDTENKTVFFTNDLIEIDLGGIAKGYAVDLAYDSIKDLNLEAGVINLGGNIRCLPNPPPGRETYIIGVRDPFDKDDIMSGTLRILNESLATSGNYERFVVIDEKRYTHIMNPKTGYPVKDMAAVTIVSPSALWADALSTAVFIKGKEFAEQIYKEFPDINILLVEGFHDKPESIHVTKIGDIWKDIQEPEETMNN